MARVGHPVPAFHVPHIVSGTAVGGVLTLLAAGGSLACRAASPLRSGFAALAERQRRNREMRELLELARSDSRVMADLVALGADKLG
jgi:hypothetical protein